MAYLCLKAGDMWAERRGQDIINALVRSFCLQSRLILLDGDTYFLPLSFYEKCGFEVLLNQRIKSDVLSAVRIKWIAKHSASSNVFS